ncbi:hypothetical protein EV385_5945 [Krasilnikovia cinnamomea]|uniref:Uncharacterized protein n=1 Tax=Krasilnikovia cinnamomea TaxID=349313 RepID=A0A4Q7ZS62_9ACTN|nr:hypothetical protein [Krasilnikovia cinnamomea]RZU54008.1 hypothetical protein EV385_5945 [Krasilnikovia cinnamomea]
MTDPLQQWREAIQPQLARLEAFEVPLGFPLDYSEDSLARLEQLLRDRRPSASLVESATAYAGEALLRVGGGRWAWADGQPVVQPDEALGLPAVAPGDLVSRADDLAATWAALAAAVRARQAAHPGWSPVKEPTPDMIEDRRPVVLPWLGDWLAEREKSFPAWAADTGVDAAAWDFTPASVDVLETVVRHRLPTGQAFTDPRLHDFVQGAVWYFGEVARRNKQSAGWQYNRSEPGATDRRLSAQYNPWVGRPFIEQLLPDDMQATVPIFDLESSVLNGTPGYLRGRLGILV